MDSLKELEIDFTEIDKVLKIDLGVLDEMLKIDLSFLDEKQGKKKYNKCMNQRENRGVQNE